MASKDSGLYVRLFDFYGLTGAKPFPELPVGNISFLEKVMQFETSQISSCEKENAEKVFHSVLSA